MALALLAKTLITAGPSLIRMAGGLLGGNKAATANKVADMVDVLVGKPEYEQQSMLNARLEQLSPDERQHIMGLQVELNKIEAERESRQLQNQEIHHKTTANVIMNGDNASSDYVRNTRPLTARLSCYATIAYTLISEFASWSELGSGPQEWIILALSSGMITYMTGRTVDAFSPHKGPRL